jgi:hypothetical protein
MSKAFLLAFSDSLGTQEQVKNWLNSIPEVSTWRFDMPHSFYIVSGADAKTIAEKLRVASGHEKGRFIVTEIPSNSWGYLTDESWYLIQNLKTKPK